MDKIFLAADMGASGTKVLSGKLLFDRGKTRLDFTEVARFPSFSYEKEGITYWDVARITESIRKAVHEAGDSSVASIGIDSWGVDFGLLDEKGRLIRDPMNYMSMFRLIEEIGGDVEKYGKKIESSVPTKFFPFNSVYQLMLYKKKFPDILGNAECMLPVPSLVARLLSGSASAKNVYEFTQATTTQVYDYVEKRWNRGLLKDLGIPDILPEVVPSGIVAGVMNEGGAEIVLPASHDTASAFAAIPAGSEGTMILSLGSWCVNGIILDKIDDTGLVMKHDLSVEGCADGRLRCLSTTTGLLLFESLRRVLRDEYGFEKSVAEHIGMAESSPHFTGFMDVDAEDFKKTGNIFAQIMKNIKGGRSGKDYSPGEIARIIFEGIAFKIAKTRKMLENAFSLEIIRIHAVGGGSKNELLCRIISDVTGLPVSTGPHEGSGIGNILVQMMALDAVSSADEAREILKNSIKVRNYFPGNYEEARSAAVEFENLFG